MDKETRKVPIAKVVEIIGGYKDADVTRVVMNRIYKKDPTLVQQVGEMMKINGRGNPCKCADSKLMIEILWAIPDNDATRAYRRQCADIIDRY